MTKLALLRNTTLIFAIVLCTAVGISLTGCKKKTEKEVTIVSISVTTQPTKTTYTVGEAFDLSGMVVTATYSDGTSASVTVNSGMITFDSSTTGTKTATITVEYKGKKVTTTISVTVNAPKATLSSIEVTKQPSNKEYAIGEPFDFSDMVVTATYSDGSKAPVTVTASNFSYDFSGGGTKTVTITVTYEGKTATTTVTGINVQTLAQRIAAAASGDIIKLYADENIASAITINKTITLISSVTTTDGMRKIGHTTQGYIFSVQSGGNLTLDTNVTLDGSGVENNNTALVLIGANATFTMKDGSKITGNNNTSNNDNSRGGGVFVSGTNASFVMLGGEINACKALKYGGGVVVWLGAFTMSGGKISDNIATNWDNDILIVEYGSTPSMFNLSDDAQIGKLMLWARNTQTFINLAGNFTGSITSIDLMYSLSPISSAKTFWTGRSVIVAGTGSGVTLTKALLDKFPLRNFLCSDNNTLSENITPGYHLYGTVAGEDTVANFGKLVVD